MSFLDIPLDSARNYLFEQAFYMALLPILRFPNPRLKKIAAPITHFDEALRRLAEDMAETMYEAPGIGRGNRDRLLQNIREQAHPYYLLALSI